MRMANGPLVALSEEVYLRSPEQTRDAIDASASVKSPSIILVFGWMQAKLAHLEKYSSEYARRYPGAIQLIVRCHPSFFIKSKAAQRVMLQPVVQFLLTEGFIVPKGRVTQNGPLPDSRHGILTHVFSNGGATVLTALSTLLAEYRLPQTPGLVPSALVLDSTPGKAHLSRTMAAFTAQMRSPFLRYAANIIICLGYLILLIYHKILRKDTLVDRFRRALLSQQFLPWGSEHTPRLYIFSRDDELVGCDDVEEHVADAKQLGYRVETEVYPRSGHVAHMRTDPTRYWTAIESLWRLAAA